MRFEEALNGYIHQIGITAKDLADASGLSTAATEAGSVRPRRMANRFSISPRGWLALRSVKEWTDLHSRSCFRPCKNH